MPVDQFQAVKKRLLRGWWLADDGRLYHDTLAERVLEMIERRDGERNRKAGYRARKQAEREAGKQEEAVERPEMSRVRPGLSHGTTTGLPRDSGGSDATGTGTSKTKEIAAAALHPRARDPVDNSLPLPAASGQAPPGSFAQLLDAWERERGKPVAFRADDPLLAAWADAGVSETELRAVYDRAVKRSAKTHDDAPVNAGLIDVILPEVRHAGGATSALSRARAMGDPLAWAASASGLTAKGAELGTVQQDGEIFPNFKARVIAAAGLTDNDRDRLRADYGVHA